jgi:hypothetical protein
LDTENKRRLYNEEKDFGQMHTHIKQAGSVIWSNAHKHNRLAVWSAFRIQQDG